MKAKARQTFFDAHPLCCFCGGRRAATQVDHVPARICFRNKVAPEGFEFPTCAGCNQGSGRSETVTAFYLHSLKDDFEDGDEEIYKRVISGICNNAPTSVPLIIGAYNREIQIPKAASRHIELFCFKLLYAIYYQTSGKVAGPSQRAFVIWAQSGTDQANYIGARAAEWFEEWQTGTRSNVDLGDQFRYRTGYHEGHGYLGMHVTFSNGIVIFGVIGPARPMATLKPAPALVKSVTALVRGVEKAERREHRRP